MGKRDNIKLIRTAEIDADSHFPGIAPGWDIEQIYYPAGWSWVRRYEETDPETGEVREVEKTCPLLGWALIRHRESGDAAFVGITADPQSPSPYPAPQADGFTGYAHAHEGQYLSGEPSIDLSFLDENEG